MFLRKHAGVLMVALIVCGASIATAGIPDLFESEATIATGGTLSLFCLPNAGGNVFADAFVKDGTGSATISADATITLTVRDGGGVVIPNVSAADLWLQWVDETGMVICADGTIADDDTDAGGVTTWEDAMEVGGSAECLVQVTINGDPLTSSAGFALHVNSGDISADGVVNLTDVGYFAGDFTLSPAPYRSDFASDTVMNLSDVGMMALGVGASCP